MEIKEIRKELIAKREQLSPSVIRESSITMTQDLLNHPQFQQFDTIYIYLPVRNEIDTSYLITKALQAPDRQHPQTAVAVGQYRVCTCCH